VSLRDEILVAMKAELDEGGYDEDRVFGSAAGYSMR
jgi:hypothetical protein